MPLTVLSVACPFSPVGPSSVGGAEQVVCRLDAALVGRGLTSLVIASEGSVLRGHHLALPAPPFCIDGPARQRRWAQVQQLIRAALDRYQVDLVHLHGVDFGNYLPPTGPPVLVTLHSPFSCYDAKALSPSRPEVFFHCVSASQRRSAPPGLELLPDIPPGVALEQLRPALRKSAVATALGRICPEQGLHLALEAAFVANLPLLLAGQVFGYPEHLAYFDEQIRPRLDRRRRFIGALGPSRKRRLLGTAQALLVPSLGEETSSLVAMEALACGTPVVAFRDGALCELVQHGQTGFLVDDVAQMAAALEAAPGLSSARCRKEAEERFGDRTMVHQYLRTYRAVAGGSRPRCSRPILEVRSHDGLRSLELLREPWQDLWTRVEGATPFVHPAWQLAWTRHLGSGTSRALSFWCGGRLAGLVSFALDGAGRWRLSGTGVSDYLDLLVEPAHRKLALETLRECMQRHGPEQPIDLRCLAPGAALLDLPWQEGVQEREEPTLLLNLPAAASLAAVLPAGLWRRVQYQRRLLSRHGAWTVREAAREQVPAFLDTLFELHRRRWAERGQTGVLEGEPLQAFHREAAAGLSAAGLLLLLRLELEGQPIAVLHGFRTPGCTYYYLGGFDPRFERFSPGTLLLAHAVEDACRRGHHTLDLLRGAEPYKRSWGAKPRDLWRLRVMGKTKELAEAQGRGPASNEAREADRWARGN